MELTLEQIEKINKLCPYEWRENEQGIFREPYGIPTHIKDLVVYMRYEKGGVWGGSCYDESSPKPYTVDEIPKFKCLDLVLKELMPSLTYLQFKEVEKLVNYSEETDWEYYGNCTEFGVNYIELSSLINKLESLN